MGAASINVSLAQAAPAVLRILVRCDMAKRLLAPKEHASEWLLNTAEGDVGSWSGLDESGDIPPQPRHFEGFPPALDPASAGTQLHWCEYSVTDLWQMDCTAHSRTWPCKVRPRSDGCQRVVSGPDKLGVGLFFRHQADDGSMRVISIVPGSSAHKRGVILTGDRLMALDEESVFGWSLQVLRQRLHGTPGSIVTLDLENPDGPEGRKRYRINLTR